jgi:hypothetical protein
MFMPAGTEGDIVDRRSADYAGKQRFGPHNQSQGGSLCAQAKAARVCLQYGLLSFESLSCVLKGCGLGLCTKTDFKGSIFMQGDFCTKIKSNKVKAETIDIHL